MSAYTYFHQEDHFDSAQKNLHKLESALGHGDLSYVEAQNSKPSIFWPQLKFLNPSACQYVNPCSKTFWPDLENWLSPISHQAASYPRAGFYRRKLKPYLLQRVTMTAKHWSLQGTHESNGLLCLTLKDVRLSHVYNSSVQADPNIIVDHMYVWISPTWMNLLPSYGHQVYDAPLSITGILYEYVSSKNIRNIGILPILLEPKCPTAAARQNRRIKGPDSPCPGLSM